MTMSRNAKLGLLLVSAQGLWAHTVTLPTSIADAGATVESVHEGLSYSEGPAFDLNGNLFFSEDPDINTGRIWKITPTGEKSVFKDPSRGSNGLEFDNQGRLHICMLDSVLRIETDGKVTVLAAKSGTMNLARVNDITINSTGAVFFSNLGGNTVFYRSPDGQFKTKTVSGANGVEWIEEKSTLYIGGNNLQKCAVNNSTGEIGACAQFAGATDGLTFDEAGNLYRANWSAGKFYVHDSTGKELGSIAIDSKDVQGKRFSSGAMGNTSNCAFGGPDRKTLYMTGDGGCYKVQLKIAGRVRPGSTAIRSANLRPQGAAEGRIRLNRFEGTAVFTKDAEKGAFRSNGRTVELPGAK